MDSNGDGMDGDNGLFWTLIWSGTDVDVLALRTISNPVVKYGFSIEILLFYAILGVLRRRVLWQCIFGAREEECGRVHGLG